MGFLVLMIASFTRPILSAFEGSVDFPVHIIVPVLITFLLLFILLVSNRVHKLDAVSLMIIVFSVYCIGSIGWGTKIEPLASLLLPFVIFISVRTFANDTKKVNKIVNLMVIGFLATIIASAILIFQNASIVYIEYYSKVVRQRGVFVHMHALGHAMMFFSYLYCFILIEKSIKRKAIIYILHVGFVLSVYCLYKSYVRSAYLGFIVFWTIYFASKKNKYFLFIITLAILYITWDNFLSDYINKIFWKTSTHDINAASSGRIGIWSHNFKVFIESPLYSKILGNGIGSFTSLVTGPYKHIKPPHNDWLELVMATGIIGIILYLSIILIIVRDIKNSILRTNLKWFFYAVIISSLITSFTTNGYVFRFENNQIFWLIIGSFYSLNKIKDLERSNLSIKPYLYDKE